MTTPLRIPNYHLEKGLEYTECIRSDACPDGSQYQTTLENRKVDLIIDLDASNTPIKATAFQPNESTCSRGVAESSACKLNLIFTDYQLDQFINSSPILLKKLSALQKPPAGRPESRNEEFKEQQNIGGTVGSATNQSMSTPDIMITLILGLLGGAAFSLIQYLVSSARKRYTKEPETNRWRSNKPHDFETQEHKQNIMEAQNEHITQEVARQLSGINQKVSVLGKDVAELQTELMSLSQKEKMPAIKTRSAVDLIPEVSFAMSESKSYLPVPPPILTVDLIRQAVAGWNYEAIANYNFDFVTETSQSFEGNTDFKCFTIDGNKSQADGRSQSEFIAISCQNVTYLIPNILKYAEGPALTINRHLDRIYKKGNGSDLTNLERLAIVRRAGDYYELVEMGQVA
jgi:hypothetical protein